MKLQLLINAYDNMVHAMTDVGFMITLLLNGGFVMAVGAVFLVLITRTNSRD